VRPPLSPSESQPPTGRRARTDDGTGTAFAFYAYDAYGMPLAAESTATASVDATLAATIAEANVLRYAGYCFDEHSGMYYLSQRYYDPATCQFITKDTAKADGEESAYQYCGGEPVGSVDPSGEWRSTVWYRRVPTYKIASWFTRQVAYLIASRVAVDAVRKATWMRSTSRVIGRAKSKAVASLTNRILGGLSWVPGFDATIAKVWDPQYRYLSGWDIYRPEVRLWVYRETTNGSYYFEAAGWMLRRIFKPSSGYRRAWSKSIVVASRARVASAVKEAYKWASW